MEVINTSTGALVGETYYQTSEDVYSDPTPAPWGHQITIRMLGGWGLTSGTTVKGDAAFNGRCSLPTSDIDFPP
ncbi:hypothetical protein ACWC10_30100 [Streptomyces sp. NPDC001595]|uniref:hypothetical protein n=1 Tax=Streptomyces sp. NPDC001532 TaxID=3154520 RepID=UPI00333406A7